MRWEWFENKEIGFIMIWSQGSLSVAFCMWTTASSAKKRFSSLHRDAWWKMDSLQQPKEKKFIGTARSCLYVVGSAEYSRCEGYAVCLVGSGRCYLLCATLRAEARKSDSTAWQRSVSRCQTCWNLPGNAQMGSHTPPTAIPRYCAIRL